MLRACTAISDGSIRWQRSDGKQIKHIKILVFILDLI